MAVIPGSTMITFHYFFFQAEDGIRDDLVTGVQTCALPISRRGGARPRPPRADLLGPQLDPEIRVSAVRHGKFADPAVTPSRMKLRIWAASGAPGRFVNADRKSVV